jgi:hypothetical protein
MHRAQAVYDETSRYRLDREQAQVQFRQVVVTGNCQAGMVGSALAALMPGAEVSSVFAWDLLTPEGLQKSSELVENSDLWVRMPLVENEHLGRGASARVLDIPALTFPAFHPDLVYATTTDGGIFRGINDYHSAIALWAWRRGVEASDVRRLYTPEVMSRLTYDQYWGPSVANLKADFGRSSLDFSAFWLRTKREGVFMHSINHPNASTVSILAKDAMIALGSDESVWSDPVAEYIDDTLSHIVWPVYPFIGGALGVQGSYRWRNGSSLYDGIDEWAETTWAIYGDTDPGSVVSPRIDDGVYDTVLEEALALRSLAL